jgi:tRNA threonylcarbamoyladenosine modification (KEOPS) complex  Pcc1 subunit
VASQAQIFIGFETEYETADEIISSVVSDMNLPPGARVSVSVTQSSTGTADDSGSVVQDPPLAL